MEKIIIKNSRELNLIGDFYPHERDKGIILCHGFTGDRHEWRHFDIIAEKLSKHFNVLAFDLIFSRKKEFKRLEYWIKFRRINCHKKLFTG